MRAANQTGLIAIAAAMLGAVAANLPAQSANGLAAEVAQLKARVQQQEDIEAIRRLQYAYNYYNQARLYKQAVDLVSDNAESIEIGGQGVYRGKQGFVRYFTGGRPEGLIDGNPTFGFVLVQLAGMEVITVAPSGTKATARVLVITPILSGFPGKVKPRMNAGIYEMGYVKESGTWLISKMKYVHAFNARSDEQGNIVPSYSTAPKGDADGPTTWYHPWPEAGILPFSFPNPVTGKYPPSPVNPTKYWIGNRPGEFGKVGTRLLPNLPKPKAGDE